MPQPGIEPATRVRALPGNETLKLLVCGTTLQPTEPPSQSSKIFLIKLCTCAFMSVPLLALDHSEPSNPFFFIPLHLAVRSVILQFLYLGMVLSLEILSQVPALGHLVFYSS